MVKLISGQHQPPEIPIPRLCYMESKEMGERELPGKSWRAENSSDSYSIYQLRQQLSTP